MKKIFSLLSLLFLSISCSQAQKTEFTPEALSSKLKDVKGQEISFQEIINKHKGKTIVIEAWASWCSDCVKSMPKLKELQAQHPEVAYVFLSADKTNEAWLKGIEKHALVGDHYLMEGGMKGSFGQSIDLNWIPRYIILDKTGKIALYRAIETDFDKIYETIKNIQ